MKSVKIVVLLIAFNLDLNGSLFINPGEILKGTRAIVEPVINAGLISPSPTLHFQNGFINYPAGGYAVDVTTHTSSRIVVTGTAEIEGGSIFVSSKDGTYSFHLPYKILEATSVLDKYSLTFTSSKLYTASLLKDPQNIYLKLQQNLSFASSSKVAAELDRITHPTPEQNLFLSHLVNLSISEAQEALDQISGYQYTEDLFITTAINRQFIRRLYNPLRKGLTPCSTVWGEAGAIFTDHSKGFQITLGIQTPIKEEWIIGLAGSYEHDTSCKTGFGGLYSLYHPTNFYILGDLSYGYSSRPSQLTFYTESGLDLRVNQVLIQPFGGIEVANFWRRGFKEPVSVVALHVHRKTMGHATSRLGFHLTYLNISFDVAWNYRLTQCRNEIRENFIQFGSPFIIQGNPLSRHTIDYALTLSTGPLYIQGSGESGSRGHIYSGLIGMSLNF